MSDIAERAAGAVWGHLIGDALGLPYEGVPAAAIPLQPLPGRVGREPRGRLDWSDDGALMLAQLDSLLTAGCDPEDFARRALRWWRDGAYASNRQPAFGIGRTTHRALSRVASGIPAEEAGGTDERDNGNGSLMRILPVALVGSGAPAGELVDCAHRLSSVTHRHPRAQVACAAYVLLVSALIADGAPIPRADHAFHELRELYADRAAADHLRELEELERWPSRSGTGYVVDSFWSAWESLTASRSYAEALERAIRLGNDADTTAAIAGGLAGARWGIAGIPGEWRQALAWAALAEGLVERLRQRLAG